MAARWTHRPDGSTWGDFGPDYRLGRLNLITPERVRAAAQDILEGLTFCLSLPLDRPGGNALSPSRFPPVLHPTLHNGCVRMNHRVSVDNPDATDLICDAMVLHTQYSTHWGAFSHVGFMFDADGDGVPEPWCYNGFRSATLTCCCATLARWTRNSRTTVAPCWMDATSACLDELWHLTPLAHWLRQAGRHRFMLTAPPLRLPGATGSPATPIATV